MKRPCICIVAGIALGEVVAYVLWGGDITKAIALAIAIVVLCIILILIDKRRSLIVMGIAFFIGFVRLSADPYTLPKTAVLNQLSLCTEGATAAEISSITVKEDRLTFGCGQLIVYYTPKEGESYSIGNTILIKGEFEPMDEPRNPGEFNYRLYYRGNGITHRCFADSVTIVDDKVNIPADAIYRLRTTLLSRIDHIFDATDAGIVKAVLLGDKTTLNEDINDLYRKNGIAHLLAISGLHMSIIGMSLYTLLRKKLHLSYGVCAIFGGAWIIFYCILTGAGVSTLRATIMLLISFLAGILGEHYDMLNAAGLAAIIILLIHPYQLFGCAFLLSFSCIFAIAGPARKIIKDLDVHNRILQSLILSITIQLVTLPVTAYFFFEVSLYGVLLNLIVIPLMTIVVWSAISATMLTFVSILIGRITGLITHLILKLYSLLGSFTSTLPLTTILIGRPSLWQIFVYYFLFFCVLYLFPLKLPGLTSPSSTSDRETAST